MKNLLKLSGIIALAAIIGLSMIGCNNDPEPTVPGAVATFEAVPGDAEVVLTWTAPADNGGSAITGYEVTMNNWTAKVTKTASQLTHTYTGLTNDTPYTFKVRAVNEKGAGAEKEAKATPSSEIPDGLSSPVLFDEGEWIADVGDVTVTNYTKTGNNYQISSVDEEQGIFMFENSIDVSDYTKLIIQVTQNGKSEYDWWAGGQLFCVYEEGYEDDDGEIFYAKFGQWGGVDGDDDLLTFTFSELVQNGPDPEDGEVEFDVSQFLGFMIQNNKITIKKIYLE